MKKAYVVLGFEGSGSVFIAKVISYVVGACKNFEDWNGYGFNKKIGEDKLVLHRSIPYMRPKKWHDDPSEIEDILSVYEEIRYVIVTRDLSASMLSRISRFEGNIESYEKDNVRASNFFKKIIKNKNCFIWNYETMVSLGDVYFEKLYNWLLIKSNFFPEVKDGNRKYLKI